MRRNILNLINQVVMVVFLAVLLSACQRPAISLNPQQEQEVGLHQRYQIDETLSFTIKSVQDNRCPMDAICIQAGKAEVKILIEEGKTKRYEVIDPENKPEIRVGNYLIRFTELFPYPQSTIQVKDKDYTLKVYISAL